MKMYGKFLFQEIPSETSVLMEYGKFYAKVKFSAIRAHNVADRHLVLPLMQQ